MALNAGGRPASFQNKMTAIHDGWGFFTRLVMNL